MKSRVGLALLSMALAVPISAGAQETSPRTEIRITLPGAGDATLLLVPVDLYAPGIRVTETGADGIPRPVARALPETFAGTVDGDPASVVRLTTGAGWVAGVVRAGGVWYSIEPDSWSAPTRTVVVRADASSLPAATLDGDTLPAGPVPPVGVAFGNCLAFPCNRLTTAIMLDGDVYFRNLGASTCADRQISVFNAVQAIYDDSPMKIDLTVSLVNCRTTTGVLGDSSTRMAQYLSNLRDSWSLDFIDDRSTVILSSGINFSDAVPKDPIGLAYIGGVCARIIAPVVTGTVAQSCSYGYGVYQAVAEPGSGYTATAFQKAKLFAHELGHNFNAEHDTGSQCKTAYPYTGPIMCPILQDSGPNTFSSASAAAIRTHAEQNIGSATGT